MMCLEYQKLEQQTEQSEPFLARFKLSQHNLRFILSIQEANKEAHLTDIM